MITMNHEHGNGTCELRLPVTSSFNTVFHEYYQPLVCFARRLVKDQAVAEDIVTDVFYKLWIRIDDFTAASAIKSFLFISTRNACLNYLQQAQYQARVRNSLRYLLDDSNDYVLNEITRAEVLRQVYQLIEELPVKCRKIILLSFSAGLSNHEIAERMNISVHTVRNQKVRGIDLVKKRLELWERQQ